MNAREEVLGRIRTALGEGVPVSDVVRDYRLTDGREPGNPALLDLLVERLEDYRATVLRCAAAALAAVPGDVVVAPGVPSDWRPDGAIEDDGRAAVDLAAFAATVTGVATAVAETGTLVLDGSPLCGRRALSLLPDVLVCVVEAAQVVGSVPEGLAVLDPLAPLTMISGPSATSDIELQRVEGVHGPRTLIVVLVA
jgi:L-lactate dehydrogenase complex protein LldG